MEMSTHLVGQSDDLGDGNLAALAGMLTVKLHAWPAKTVDSARVKDNI